MTKVKYLHNLCPYNSEALAGGCCYGGGCHMMAVLLSTQDLSLAFYMQTMKAAGKLAIQSKKSCSGLPASLSPVARPDWNKGRKHRPQTAGEFGWVRLPEFWSLPGQGRMVFC